VSAAVGAARPRRWWIALIVAASLAAALLGWRALPTQRDRERETLSAALQATPPGQALDLARAVSGSWDHVLIAGPHETKERIRQASGGGLPPDLKDLDLGVDEGANVLVFLQKDAPGKSIGLPRRVADFADDQSLRPVPRDQARLMRAASGVAFSWQKP
jgi:hypothetical protein